MNKTKKILLTLLLFAFLNMALAPAARADTWGANMMAAIWKQTTEQIVKSIQDTILANLKMAALRIIQARLLSLLGSSGGAQVPGVAGYIISDWKMFIYGSATRYSNQVTNDFFRNLQSGSTSAMNRLVLNPAQRAVNTDYWNMRPDLQYYCPGGDPTKAFSAGTSNQWKCWQMSGAPQNDLAMTTLRAESYKQAAFEQEAKAKEAEGVSGQGVKSKEEKTSTSNRGSYTATSSQGGKVTVPPGSNYTGGQKITTPGSIIGNLMNEINNMPVRMLTLARSVPEIATAMVNQMITQVIQQGVTKMISPGGSAGSSNMGAQMQNQAQMLIQSGVRRAASPNMFFGR